ncbi:hypothetical protein BB561_001505 [Smittium simulii]|uniref:Multifunctional fusion protein n=1 Tax=Smittium simulii TaxID=133385 RepID=A0A2T9YUH3_9FUNG|nr:hypothetical protein BB561_001505 [Smittium simulii]
MNMLQAFRSSRVCLSYKQASSLFQHSKAPLPTGKLSTHRVSQFAMTKNPDITNEPMRDYLPKKVQGQTVEKQLNPSKISDTICTFEMASDSQIQQAIQGSLEARKTWSEMPIYDRQAVFLKAADLIANKYRYLIMASTMLGQGKNIWQAEIDAAAESVDFLRFNVKYSTELYSTQPPENSPGSWNHMEYRPLEGFVYAVSPFNFTAIGLNLSAAPALMGNVVLWKPSNSAVLSNYLMYKILEEAGLPPGVIQFVPGDAVSVSKKVFESPDFAALHFTGSTHVFKSLWKTIGNNIDIYKSYPRIVGETGGKNFHLIHNSANIDNVVNQTIRGAFEYQGQKCSACSRVYVPSSLWPEFKSKITEKLQSVKLGNISNPENFLGPVINDTAFNRIKSYIEYAENAEDCTIISGGKCDSSVGYYIEPTIIQTTNIKSKPLIEEIFGPVLTAYVYPDNEFEKIISIIDSSTSYGLTGAVFAQDREAVIYASNKLVNAAGNFYINDKSTGAVVGQQPFGGSRSSGTNDKAGSASILSRFVSPRSVKETFLPISDYTYPSNLL